MITRIQEVPIADIGVKQVIPTNREIDLVFVGRTLCNWSIPSSCVADNGELYLYLVCKYCGKPYEGREGDKKIPHHVRAGNLRRQSVSLCPCAENRAYWNKAAEHRTPETACKHQLFVETRAILREYGHDLHKKGCESMNKNALVAMRRLPTAEVASARLALAAPLLPDFDVGLGLGLGLDTDQSQKLTQHIVSISGLSHAELFAKYILLLFRVPEMRHAAINRT